MNKALLLNLPKINDEAYDRIHQFFPITDVCPTCDDKKTYKLDGDEHECDCETQKLLQKHYFTANIGREYHDICLKDFIGSDREIVVPIVEEYVKNFSDKFHYGLGVTFTGPVGTGKTFAMNCILKGLIQQGRDVYSISFEEMINTWASAWQDATVKRQLENKLKSVDVLGLDEVKTDNRNDSFLAHGFESVIRHRTANLLPTIITTNMTQQSMERVFPKITSLLGARNAKAELTGKDLRKKEIRYRVLELEKYGERRPIC